MSAQSGCKHSVLVSCHAMHCTAHVEGVVSLLIFIGVMLLTVHPRCQLVVSEGGMPGLLQLRLDYHRLGIAAGHLWKAQRMHFAVEAGLLWLTHCCLVIWLVLAMLAGLQQGLVCPATVVRLAKLLNLGCAALASWQKRKEQVYASRRTWEALDRPWRPFSAVHHDVGKQASGLSISMGIFGSRSITQCAPVPAQPT